MQRARFADSDPANATSSSTGKKLHIRLAAGGNNAATTSGQGGRVALLCGAQCDAVDQLEGFTIGVTADRRAAEQTELLHRRGAEVLVGASLHTENWVGEAAVNEATRQVIADPPDVLIATTGIGIRGWLSFAESRGMDTGLHYALSATRILARGPKAAGAVAQAGLAVAETEQSEQLDLLVAGLVRGGVRGQVVALQLFGAGSPSAVRALEEAGAHVITVLVYRSGLPPDVGPAVRLVKASLDGRVDAVTFTSRPALEQLFTIARGEGLEEALRAALNREVLCCCVGPVTANAARAQGIENPIFPERGRLGLMVRRLAEVLHCRHHHVANLACNGPDIVIQGCTVRAGVLRVTLTRRERAVLDILSRRPGAIVSRPTLLREVWAGDSLHVVDITVGRLRQRLQPLGLRIWATHHGYRIEATPPPQWLPQAVAADHDG